MGLNLSTVANVKAYLAITSAGQDALIAQLLPRESRQIENWTGRGFSGLVARTNRRFDGKDTDTLYLPDTPILSITSLTIDGTVIPASPDGIASGYLIDDDKISLIDYAFCRGRQNVVVSWTAGYLTGETDTIPAGNAPVLSPTTDGLPVQVASVTDAASGIVFTQVAANPATAQFTFNAATASLGFNQVDAGRSVAMGYYYVPEPIQQACIEMVGLDLKQRDNLGVNSKTLAGESISYTSKGMTASVVEMLQPYRRLMVA